MRMLVDIFSEEILTNFPFDFFYLVCVDNQNSDVGIMPQ